MVTQKLDLDQMSERGIRMIRTDGHKYDKTQFLLQIVARLSLDDSDDICGLKWRIKCPSNFHISPRILPLFDCFSLSVCIIMYVHECATDNHKQK